VRKDCGYSSADIRTADDGRVSDRDTLDIGNRVERAWLQHTDNDAELSRTWPRRILRKYRRQHQNK
jgi:hypothetical protein